MHLSNAVNIYDAYTIYNDERGIYSITKDKIIQSTLETKILFAKDLKTLDIEIEVFYGTVYILGLVKNEQSIQKLIKLAKNTNGVKKIETYIKIKEENYPCNNINILANLKKNLFTDDFIKWSNVRVSVVGCDVIFTGVVSSKKYEKHAVWYATHTDGVKDVYSFLKPIK